MLPGSGLSDDSLLSHPPGKQTLPQCIVDFMGTCMCQVLSLEKNLCPAAMID
jgi:hypothetical protein